MSGMPQEALDGDLAARVFELLQAADTGSHQRRYGERSRQRLDLAVLAFFQSFRKVYVGEQTMHSSKARRSCMPTKALTFGVASGRQPYNLPDDACASGQHACPMEQIENEGSKRCASASG